MAACTERSVQGLVNSVDDLLRHFKRGRAVKMDFLKWAVQRAEGSTLSTPPALGFGNFDPTQ